MEEYGVPGASIAIVSDFKLKQLPTYGVADRAQGTEVTEHTQFQAASISKLVTAVAALKLVEEGRIGLDDDITRRCTPGNSQTIAIRKSRR